MLPSLSPSSSLSFLIVLMVTYVADLSQAYVTNSGQAFVTEQEPSSITLEKQLAAAMKELDSKLRHIMVPTEVESFFELVSSFERSISSRLILPKELNADPDRALLLSELGRNGDKLSQTVAHIAYICNMYVEEVHAILSQTQFGFATILALYEANSNNLPVLEGHPDFFEKFERSRKCCILRLASCAVHHDEAIDFEVKRSVDILEPMVAKLPVSREVELLWKLLNDFAQDNNFDRITNAQMLLGPSRSLIRDRLAKKANTIPKIQEACAQFVNALRSSAEDHQQQQQHHHHHHPVNVDKVILSWQRFRDHKGWRRRAPNLDRVLSFREACLSIVLR